MFCLSAQGPTEPFFVSKPWIRVLTKLCRKEDLLQETDLSFSLMHVLIDWYNIIREAFTVRSYC